MSRISEALRRTLLGALLALPLAAGAGVVGEGLAAQLESAAKTDTIRVVVQLREQADALAAAAGAATRAQRSSAVIRALRAAAARGRRGVAAWLDAQYAAGNVRDIRQFWVVNGLAFRAKPHVIRALAAHPRVASVTLDAEISLSPTTPGAVQPAAAAAEWGVERVGAPAIWNGLGPFSTRGEGSVVGILDSGVDPTHPDLQNGPDAWLDAALGASVPYDVSEVAHGTHVTGTAVGGDTGGSSIGVAPGARYISCNAFRGEIAFISDFLRCMEFFLDPDGDPATADQPDVVNNSWASIASFCNPLFQSAIRSWWAVGIFPAFAAGNSGPGPGSGASPAQNPGAFGVGATDVGDGIASFSARGPSSCDDSIFPEVSAPGVDVRSSVRDGGYASYSGTSMATPHVAGCVALMRSAADLDGALGLPQSIWDWFLMTSYAADLGPAGPDNTFGAGRLDCLRSTVAGILFDIMLP